MFITEKKFKNWSSYGIRYWRHEISRCVQPRRGAWEVEVRGDTVRSFRDRHLWREDHGKSLDSLPKASGRLWGGSQVRGVLWSVLPVLAPMWSCLAGWGSFGKSGSRICPPPVCVPSRCLRTPLCVQPGLSVSGLANWGKIHVPELLRASDSVELQSAGDRGWRTPAVHGRRIDWHKWPQTPMEDECGKCETFLSESKCTDRNRIHEQAACLHIDREQQFL